MCLVPARGTLGVIGHVSAILATLHKQAREDVAETEKYHHLAVLLGGISGCSKVEEDRYGREDGDVSDVHDDEANLTGGQVEDGVPRVRVSAVVDEVVVVGLDGAHVDNAEDA